MRKITLNPQTATFDDLTPVARVLLDGGIIAGPTESFYGLMAVVSNHRALEKLQELKSGRGEEKPFLILIDQILRVNSYAREVPDAAKPLMDKFWPGLLTILFTGRPGLHQSILGPTKTVGIRLEGVPLVRRLARMVDRGLTGTSANLPGQTPPTTPEEVADYFGNKINLLIDAGPTPGGQPSTIVDVSLGAPRVVRAGCLDEKDLLEATPGLRL